MTRAVGIGWPVEFTLSDLRRKKMVVVRLHPGCHRLTTRIEAICGARFAVPDSEPRALPRGLQGKDPGLVGDLPEKMQRAFSPKNLAIVLRPPGSLLALAILVFPCPNASHNTPFSRPE